MRISAIRKSGWLVSVVVGALAVGVFGYDGRFGTLAQGSAGSSGAGDQAAVDGVLNVGGDVPTPHKLTRSDIAQLHREEARVKDRSGVEAIYAGPTLAEVLQAAGLKFDPAVMPPKGAVASYVLIDARDGYKALFALAEVDPTLSGQVILLADAKNGQPLNAAEGPWRVIAPGDKRPARSVRQVTSITVHGG